MFSAVRGAIYEDDFLEVCKRCLWEFYAGPELDYVIKYFRGKGLFHTEDRKYFNKFLDYFEFYVENPNVRGFYYGLFERSNAHSRVSLNLIKLEYSGQNFNSIYLRKHIDSKFVFVTFEYEDGFGATWQIFDDMLKDYTSSAGMRMVSNSMDYPELPIPKSSRQYYHEEKKLMTSWGLPEFKGNRGRG